jgi:hypothetical protein
MNAILRGPAGAAGAVPDDASVLLVAVGAVAARRLSPNRGR